MTVVYLAMSFCKFTSLSFRVLALAKEIKQSLWI